MAKIGSFLHTSEVTGDVVGIDTSYNVARVHLHQLLNGSGQMFQDRIESISVRFTSVVGATSATIRLCWDAAGDNIVIPDTTTDLSAGITTTTSACGAIYFGAPVRAPANDTIYLFVKLDAGTAVLDSSTITWSE